MNFFKKEVHYFYKVDHLWKEVFHKLEEGVGTTYSKEGLIEATSPLIFEWYLGIRRGEDVEVGARTFLKFLTNEDIEPNEDDITTYQIILDTIVGSTMAGVDELLKVGGRQLMSIGICSKFLKIEIEEDVVVEDYK